MSDRAPEEHKPGIDLAVPAALFDDPALERGWRARIRSARMTLPASALDDPSRSVYASNGSGTYEVYVWDRSRAEHRQVTDRPKGTVEAAISADGEHVWWFADTDGDEFGHWMRESFSAGEGAAEPALAEIPDGYPSGICVGLTTAVVGIINDDDGFGIWAGKPGEDARRIYAHEDGMLDCLSRDETLVAFRHAEHGDSRNPGIRVLSPDGTSVAEQRDEGKPLNPLGWAPTAGDQRLLVQHERNGRPELLLWDVGTGTQTPLEIELPGELSGSWYPDGRALLIVQNHAGRGQLHRYELASGALEKLPTTPGCISAAQARPDGSVEYGWSSAAHPSAIRRCDGQDDERLLDAGDAVGPSSVPVEDVWIDGPGGRIHTFISRPENLADGPQPTVFYLHGGPHMADEDRYDAMRAAWIDAGFVVVNLNYRGSSGYGQAWRDAIIGRPGLTELEDLAAVQDWCDARGISDRPRSLVVGFSWGGYLSLLAVGTQPERWAAGIAGVPIADYVTAYEDEAPPFKAMDRALFGGAPEDLPQRYADSSPITYSQQVEAPVLVLAGANDPRCPIRQIDNYLRVLEARGQRPHVCRDDAGHGPTVNETVEKFTAAGIAFAQSHVLSGG
ncbi:S9 family peptidase [Pseudonocardia xishanensis]|uniref:Prolyl oligopeptidase family serine peptidase n=1 Tax=Pseudonocardia xishanensis TaxID=630995 RepID=A0ABP8RZR3_9PSEU